jgi:hypothetical protein
VLTKQQRKSTNAQTLKHNVMIFRSRQHFLDALCSRSLPGRLQKGGTSILLMSKVKVKVLYEMLAESYDCKYHTLDGKSENKPQNILTNFADMSKFAFVLTFICKYV